MPIAANLMGRLGNQMFQIAAAYSLAIDNNDIAIFPVIPQGTIPQAHEQLFYVSSILSNVTYGYDFSWIRKTYEEPSFSYIPIPYAPDMLINGYFQSEKYFSHNREKIKELFQQTPYVNLRLRKYAHLLTKEYIAIHVRRGDYVKQSDTHTNLAENTDYYDISMERFHNHKKVFFSDDLEWCSMNFGPEHTYITNENDVVEMFLFSQIANKIVSNSSFSWWAAWLGADDCKNIIAPASWFGPKNSHLNTDDIIPASWTKV